MLRHGPDVNRYQLCDEGLLSQQRDCRVVGGSIKSFIVVRHLKIRRSKAEWGGWVVKDLQSVVESCISEENSD